MSEPVRPDPPAGARNLVVLVLDSLRFDTWQEVAPANLGRLGSVERRWSYASWTSPSHVNLLTGLVPHTSPRHVHASVLYREEYARYGERLGVAGIEFRSLLPGLWLPSFLRDGLGYRTGALVSMPVLNPATVVNRGFDRYELMPTHNDLGAMVRSLTFNDDRPSFWLLNAGETHYPYAVAGDDAMEWPRLHGVLGAVRALGSEEPEPASGAPAFDPDQLAELHRRQLRALEHVDRIVAALYAAVPDDTWLIVTSDHGELFGEDGYFGHGPIAHEKVLEVPFVEGVRP